MRIQVYTAYNGAIVIGVATPRDQAAPSTKFTAGTVHEDFAARVRALLKEHKHIAPTSEAFPATARLATYLPTFQGRQLYAFRELRPAGAPRGIDGEWELMTIRYDFMLNLLPAAFAADEITAEGIERNVEFAIRGLFIANAIPDVFIPGNKDQRPDGTDVDIRCDLGPSGARTGIDIPQPG